MRRLRTTSTRRLLTILACAGVLATTAAFAQAALGESGPIPSPKALAQAITDALAAPTPDGVSADITFKNNLVPSGSLPGVSSPLTSGADGRLWLTKDGRFRLELQSSSVGDVQIVGDRRRVTVFDSASNTVYRATMPEAAKDGKPGDEDENPTAAKVQAFLDRIGSLWTVSGADPTSTAGQPTYTVKVSPKDDGGLLGAAQLAWDAKTGVPLRAAVYAQGQSDPVLELEASDISYGAVSNADVTKAPPSGAKVVDLSPQASKAPSEDRSDAGAAREDEGREDEDEGVSGVAAVRKELDFPLAAPDELAGLPRQGAHLVDFDGHKGALVTYGKGLGAIAVFQHKPDAKEAKDEPSADEQSKLPLPQINIDGTTGTEIATALGTIVSFKRDGVSYVVAGFVPPLAAENAARGLK